MELDIAGETVTLRLTLTEATRLGVAIAAGYEAVSRAEYFIRTGLSEPVMRLVAEALMNVPGESSPLKTILMDAGVEEIENPRRPRPNAT